MAVANSTVGSYSLILSLLGLPSSYYGGMAGFSELCSMSSVNAQQLMRHPCALSSVCDSKHVYTNVLTKTELEVFLHSHR